MEGGPRNSQPWEGTHCCGDRRLPWPWRGPAPRRCQLCPACRRAARTPGRWGAEWGQGAAAPQPWTRVSSAALPSPPRLPPRPRSARKLQLTQYRALTSRMAEQKRLCRTRCRACSFCGGSSPLRCSRSSSSTARDTSAERGGGREGTHGRQEGRPRSGWKRPTLPAGPSDPSPGWDVRGALGPGPSHARRPSPAHPDYV